MDTVMQKCFIEQCYQLLWLYSIHGTQMNECGSLTQWHGHGKTKVSKEKKDIEGSDLGLSDYSSIYLDGDQRNPQSFLLVSLPTIELGAFPTLEPLYSARSFTVNYEMLSSLSAITSPQHWPQDSECTIPAHSMKGNYILLLHKL